MADAIGAYDNLRACFGSFKCPEGAEASPFAVLARIFEGIITDFQKVESEDGSRTNFTITCRGVRVGDLSNSDIAKEGWGSIALTVQQIVTGYIGLRDGTGQEGIWFANSTVQVSITSAQLLSDAPQAEEGGGGFLNSVVSWGKKLMRESIPDMAFLTNVNGFGVGAENGSVQLQIAGRPGPVVLTEEGINTTQVQNWRVVDAPNG